MKILMTGATGGVATYLRPMLIKSYGQVLLSDRIEPPDLQPGESFVAADLTDPTAVDRVVAGVDGIIHLGGQSVEADWQTVLDANIIGGYNLFESAHKAGVGRVVFASSNHAVGFHQRSETIGPETTLLSDSRYGVSKAFGESLGAMYAYKHGMQVTCLRIGNVDLRPVDRRRLSIWLHPEDLMQLVQIGLTHDEILFEVLYGMSDNKRAWWSNERAYQLGYQPAHRSEDFAEHVLAQTETADPVADLYQGGTFCSAEYTRKN